MDEHPRINESEHKGSRSMKKQIARHIMIIMISLFSQRNATLLSVSVRVFAGEAFSFELVVYLMVFE